MNKIETNHIVKNITMDAREWLITQVYSKICMDIPTNHEEIVKYIVEDVQDFTDNPTSADFAIAFRRMLEEKISEK